jgi:glucose/arabinose dehydrogenase
MGRTLPCTVLLLAMLAAGGEGSVADRIPYPGLDGIILPDGFRIEVYAPEVPGARSLCLGDRGTVFVGTRGAGAVYALSDTDGEPGADEVHVLAEGLSMPNGVAFRDGDLYVAEIHRVIRFDGIEDRLADPPEPVVVRDDFPRDRAHGWKFIAFGPDGMLYVPVGAPCNVCEPDDPRYCSILRMAPDGTGLELYATGIRNTVGFDWHPETGELWFTDNGRDGMGDNRPPDELNRVTERGQHFGFPYLHGRDVADPEFGELAGPRDIRLPEMELGPHVAALGMRFYTGEMFPDEYRGQVFIAEHGSWNRSTPIGYRVMLVRLEDGEAVSYEVFAEGWLTEEGAFGRPVDVQVMPDGAMLVSDDRAGKVYRIAYGT